VILSARVLRAENSQSYHKNPGSQVHRFRGSQVQSSQVLKVLKVRFVLKVLVRRFSGT